MAADLGTLRTNLTSLFGGKLVSVEEKLGELTVVVKAAVMLDVLTRLRDATELRFEQMIDLTSLRSTLPHIPIVLRWSITCFR
jgi:NADH-quinone oxidoreductase subunit C